MLAELDPLLGGGGTTPKTAIITVVAAMSDTVYIDSSNQASQKRIIHNITVTLSSYGFFV